MRAMWGVPKGGPDIAARRSSAREDSRAKAGRHKTSMRGYFSTLVAALVYVPMLVEARRASRNERAQRARGGIEPPGDVYRLMRLVYPGAFLLMLAEGAIRGGP